MRLFASPLIWMLRFRHRCGYGVQSPFAFHFITDVIYERSPFYAYDELSARLPWRYRHRVRRGLELLLRLSNYQQPSLMAMDAESPLHEAYLRAGCAAAQVRRLGELTSCRPDTGPARHVDLCFLRRPDSRLPQLMAQGGMLVLDDLHRHRRWFRALPATLFFDLHDMGIALFDVPYHKQYYKVNF